MNFHRILAITVAAGVATGCAFFDEPLSDPGITVPSGIPADTTAAEQTIPAPTNTNAPAAPQPTEQTPSAQQPLASAATGGSYLIVAPIEEFPQDASNIAVVHLTNRSSNRDLAICKALMENFTTVDVGDIPAQPLTVTVWPVPNDNAGANCIEMITEYEAIELTAQAEDRIAESDKGPFLLTRNLPTGKRMIYDLSFKTNGDLSSAVNQWITLIGSAPENWPDYRRAR
jgi:hypothetical protein